MPKDRSTTTNLSDFGNRELRMLRDLITAMLESGLPKDFSSEGVTPMMNLHSGNVFLTNDEYQVAMLNGEELESFYTTPYKGEEGFFDELVDRFDEMHPDDQEYLRSIAEVLGREDELGQYPDAEEEEYCFHSSCHNSTVVGEKGELSEEAKAEGWAIDESITNGRKHMYLLCPEHNPKRQEDTEALRAKVIQLAQSCAQCALNEGFMFLRTPGESREQQVQHMPLQGDWDAFYLLVGSTRIEDELDLQLTFQNTYRNYLLYNGEYETEE